MTPFYYLENFQRALGSLQSRYADLLTETEQSFIRSFQSAPQPSAALLVRMLMRRGDLFRTSRLLYSEIGSADEALPPLEQSGWITVDPPLTLQELCQVLNRRELCTALSLRRTPRAFRTERAHQQLRLPFTDEERRPASTWWRGSADRVLRVSVSRLCTQLRLLFFGNFRQDWTSFVLVDLGMQRFESVPFSPSSRPFQSRAEIEQFHALYELAERMSEGEPAELILQAVPPPLGQGWLEQRRSKLLFMIARQLERAGRLPEALSAYGASSHPDARLRETRVLERQRRTRTLRKIKAEWQTFELTLRPTPGPLRVEHVVRQRLEEPAAPVVYVENALVNSLFGLTCWEALFAPVPGAFFHPFQAAPADLLEPEFRSRRAAEFATCFARMESGAYAESLIRTFRAKAGIQCPFVAWRLLTPKLLRLALTCIPRAHLRLMFERLLADLRLNRTGLPDLIQFFPAERRYRMIEVKGPGDRLQDNQIRWLQFCVSKELPVAVCRLNWRS
jgi:hypothetical protein